MEKKNGRYLVEFFTTYSIPRSLSHTPKREQTVDAAVCGTGITNLNPDQQGLPLAYDSIKRLRYSVDETMGMTLTNA